jgi:hypothetical protein
MALIACPDCGQQMSDAAPACPRCGKPRGSGKRRGLFVALVLAGAMVAAVLFLRARALEASKKPSIETHCTMNGHGVGECTFTNTGTGSGSLCGTVFVAVNRLENNTLRSSAVCSGEVAARSTGVVPFTVVGVSDACSPRKLGYDKPGLTWTDVCAFAFEDSSLTDVSKEAQESLVSGDLAQHVLAVTTTVERAK